MKQAIQTYGSLWLLTIIIIILIQVCGIVITYKEVSDIGQLVVETIEVNDGLDEDKISKIKGDYPSFIVECIKEADSKYYYYQVEVRHDYKIPILNFTYNINSSFRTKRLNI